MNMDYALTQALKYCSKCKRAFHFYDINCSYSLYLRDRCTDHEYLDLPPEMDIVFGIPIWHVHGHQDLCHPRYAPSFITGAAQLDGEIIETLWVPLNEISPSTRYMSMAYRQETLDLHMNDVNWKKITNTGTFSISGG